MWPFREKDTEAVIPTRHEFTGPYKTYFKCKCGSMSKPSNTGECVIPCPKCGRTIHTKKVVAREKGHYVDYGYLTPLYETDSYEEAPTYEDETCDSDIRVHDDDCGDCTECDVTVHKA